MINSIPITFEVESHKNIFNLILKHKKISAASLARITGMQKSTLLYIIRALEGRNLIRIHTKVFKTKERGRPSTLYEINGDLYNILGVEFVPGSIRILLTNLKGEIIKQNSSDFSFSSSSELHSKMISQLDRWGIRGNSLLGIGISLPGMVDTKTGTIISSKPLEMSSFPLEAEMQELFSVPVRVYNDAKAGAAGTYLFSEIKEIEWDNVLFYAVSLSFKGIGTGLIFDGRPYYGSTGQSGEIFKSLPSIEKLCTKYGIDPSDFYNSDKGKVSPELEKVFNKLKGVIAHIIVDTSQLLNPDYFEIGGDVTSYKVFFNDYIVPEIKRLQKKQYLSECKPPSFNPSAYGEYSNALGAAASILQEVLN